MTGTEIFKRSTSYEGEAETIRLHAPQWKLLLAFDGQRSLAEVALSVEVPFVEALPLTEKFLDEGWLEEQPITLDQYLKRTGASSSAAVGSAVTPPVVLHEAKPETPAPAPAAPMAPATPAAPVAPISPVPAPPVPLPPVAKANIPPPPAPAVRAAAPPLAPRAATPPPLKAASPVAPPVVAAAPVAAIAAAPLPPPVVRARGPMRLKAVVDYIVTQVGNSSLGQLVVYRVFLRVPPQLLQAEDIASVHLLNDQSVVKSEALKQAIASSVLEVLKRSLPESVFAGA